MRAPKRPELGGLRGAADRYAGKHRDAAHNRPNAATSLDVDASAPSAATCALRTDPRFRRLTDHLHRLGPRPVGELLAALAAAHGIEGDVLARLERFGELDPLTVAALAARDWPPLPVHEVAA